jgi:hypothetical protein
MNVDAIGSAGFATRAMALLQNRNGENDFPLDHEGRGRRGGIEHGHSAHGHHGPGVRQPDSPLALPPGSSLSVDALSYRRTERTSLLIQTQEGDVVELKIKSRDALSLDSATLETGDRLLSELQLRSAGSTKISISVNGDLNADELSAIQSVVEKAGILADKFFAGDLDAAFADASALQMDGTQLASVGLRLSMRERLTYEHLGVSRPALAPPPASAPQLAAPEPGAAAPTAAVEAPASAAPDDPAASGTGNPLDSSVALLKKIGEFIAQLRDTLGDAAPAQGESASGASIQFSLKIKIFQSIVATIASNSPAADDAASDAPADTPTLPDLLQETLDALGASRQLPLEAAA